MSKNIIKIKGGAIKFTTGTPEIRAEKCRQGLQELLKHFDCMLVPTITNMGNDIIGYQMHGDVGVIPTPQKSRIVTPSGEPTVH